MPRHHNWYATYTYNEQSDDNSPSDNKSTFGLYRVDKVLKTCLVNKVLGTPIINYSYEPRSGYLKPGKLPMLMNYRKNNGFPDRVKSSLFPYSHNIPSWANITAKKDNIIMNGQLASFGHNYAARVNGNYLQQLESYVYIDPQKGASHTAFTVQPQVHIGLLATPALNPAKETAEF